MIAKKYFIIIYREGTKTSMEEPYFYYSSKMVKIATESGVPNLSKISGSRIQKSISPKPVVQIFLNFDIMYIFGQSTTLLLWVPMNSIVKVR